MSNPRVLFVGGERYLERATPVSSGGPKRIPWSFSEAQEAIVNNLDSLRSNLGATHQDLRMNQALVCFRMFPGFRTVGTFTSNSCSMTLERDVISPVSESAISNYPSLFQTSPLQGSGRTLQCVAYDEVVTTPAKVLEITAAVKSSVGNHCNLSSMYRHLMIFN